LIRLFIISFLLTVCLGSCLMGRTVPISVISCQLSVISYQLDSISLVDSSLVLSDTVPDTSIGAGGTGVAPYQIKYSKDSLDAKVTYYADDSIMFDMSLEKVFLYGNTEVKYTNITLEAAYMEIDWANNLIIAEGRPDSTGKIAGEPIFTEKEDVYNAKKIIYNYQTKQGKIYGLLTQEGDGYLHGEEVKKMENDELYIRNAKYTTCDAEEPHFYINVSKLKVVPDKVIVSGPANLKVAGVPTPLFLPFAIFPIHKKQASGIILPIYGESTALGFFLRRGGYYFGISDKIDLELLGDIYTNGSWGAHLTSNYAKRYKFNGLLRLDYGIINTGEPGAADFLRRQDFRIYWTYNQDQKARPYSNFSINIDASSSSYFENHSYDREDFLSSRRQSSVSYNKKFAGTPFNFIINAGLNQNIITRLYDFTLPSASLAMSRVYPFKRKVQTGKKRWYEKIGMSYKLLTKNTLKVIDTLLFEETTLKKFRYGVKHEIPNISSSFKVLKYFTLTPSAKYVERWYPHSIKKAWVGDSIVQVDTLYGFKRSNNFDFKVSLNTRLYGMLQFKKGKIKAIRHVLTPNISFNYRPDFSDPFWGYYQSVQVDTAGTMQQYSIFAGSVYGSPLAGKHAGIRLALDNNLEMKVRTPKDTAHADKKIKLIQSLNISTFYNIAADSVKLSPIRFSGKTKLFNKFNITLRGSFDPYVWDSSNTNFINRLNRFWIDEGKLARLSNATLTVSTKLSSKSNQNEGVYAHPFSMDWHYNLTYDRRFRKNITNDITVDSIKWVQSINFNLNLDLTPKWKVIFSSGYDFVGKEITYSSVDISRDLHCWEMRFRWIPFGRNKSYNFTLSAKSSLLQDLKIMKRRDWYDN